VPKSRTRLVEVRLTVNFEANLAAIEGFLSEQEFAQGYDRLLDELGEVVISNLERFPAMGRPFFTHTPHSVEALAIVNRLRATLTRIANDADLREYILRDYVILYALVQGNVYLLSIKHHRQLSFDLGRFWRDDS
jgi:ParE toxin of type II toxin-antitoxin system, parDE